MAMICFLEKIGVLGKLHLGMSQSVGCEFNVNEAIIWYIQKKEKEIWQPICEPTPQSTKVTSVLRNEAMEKWKCS